MYLLLKILRAFSGSRISQLKNFRLQFINSKGLVFNRVNSIFGMLIISVGLLGISCTTVTPDDNISKTEVVEPQANEHKELIANLTPSKYIVTIKDMKYNPAVTQAQIGDTILFTNKDLVPHNIADSLTKEWLSPQLNFGEEWSMIVTKNLHFYCAYHPNMEGDIQVEAQMSAQKSK